MNYLGKASPLSTKCAFKHQPQASLGQECLTMEGKDF